MSEGLVVGRLTVAYPLASGTILGANAVSFAVRPGERLGVVGESGSGKSTTALALLRLIRPPGRVAGGRVVLNGTDLRALDEDAMRAARLQVVSYIPQGAMNSLNPVKTVAAQMRDAIIDHGGTIGPDTIARALEGVDLPLARRACILISSAAA